MKKDQNQPSCDLKVLLGSLTILAASIQTAAADESGVSFWLPGQYGSFAALPPETGFSMPLMTYAYTGDVSADRVFQSGNQLRLGLDTDFVAQFIIPTYSPDTEIWGAQPAFSLAFLPSYNSASANATLGSASGSISDSVTGFGDLYPAAQLFWARGVHNYMAYFTGNIPVGNYDPNRLSNLGLGHAAIDIGGAYTYANPDTGWEFSVTGGVTYNFENSDTNYRNGTSLHLDMAASRFVSETTHVGLVGFAYQQVSDDTGQSPILGDTKSRTFGIGPQIGWFFGDPERPSYFNIRAYKEFATRYRVEGGGVFFTLSFPIG
ncbi:MAG: SphA family protein [Ruegeria sp.]